MLVLGHRGALHLAPENTLESFAAALRAGADGVELDARMTADHRLVVRHDDAFVSGARLSELTFAGSLELDAAIPTLGGALDVLREALCVVEMKSQPGRNDRFCDLVAAVIDGRDQHLLVSSFDPAVLEGMRKRLPELRTAQLVGLVADAEHVARVVESAAQAGHCQVHVERRILLGALGDGVVEDAAGADLDVVAWTVNDAGELDAFRSRGITAVITDLPDELVRARDAR